MWLRFLVNTWVRQQAQETLQSLMAEAIRGEPVPKKGTASSQSADSRSPPGKSTTGKSTTGKSTTGKSTTGKAAPGKSSAGPPAVDRRHSSHLDARSIQSTDNSSLDEGDTADIPAVDPRASRPPCAVAVLFALELEAAGFVERMRDVIRTQCASFVEYDGFLGETRVIVAETGVGLAAARRAADDLLTLHHPAWVVSAGFAGGLAEQVRKGHFIMAEQVVHEDGRELTVGLKLPPEVLAAQKSLHAGRIVSVDRLIREESDKRQLAEKHRAVACDMETWAIAESCAAHKTRFISVRVVTDAVDDTLPREIENLLEQKSLAGKLGAVAGALLHRPSSVKDMWKLYEEAQRGSNRLARFLEGATAQLH